MFTKDSLISTLVDSDQQRSYCGIWNSHESWSWYTGYTGCHHRVEAFLDVFTSCRSSWKQVLQLWHPLPFSLLPCFTHQWSTSPNLCFGWLVQLTAALHYAVVGLHLLKDAHLTSAQLVQKDSKAFSAELLSLFILTPAFQWTTGLPVHGHAKYSDEILVWVVLSSSGTMPLLSLVSKAEQDIIKLDRNQWRMRLMSEDGQQNIFCESLDCQRCLTTRYQCLTGE